MSCTVYTHTRQKVKQDNKIWLYPCRIIQFAFAPCPDYVTRLKSAGDLLRIRQSDIFDPLKHQISISLATRMKTYYSRTVLKDRIKHADASVLVTIKQIYFPLAEIFYGCILFRCFPVYRRLHSYVDVIGRNYNWWKADCQVIATKKYALKGSRGKAKYVSK